MEDHFCVAPLNVPLLPSESLAQRCTHACAAFQYACTASQTRLCSVPNACSALHTPLVQRCKPACTALRIACSALQALAQRPLLHSLLTEGSAAWAVALNIQNKHNIKTNIYDVFGEPSPTLVFRIAWTQEDVLASKKPRSQEIVDWYVSQWNYCNGKGGDQLFYGCLLDIYLFIDKSNGWNENFIT